MMPPVVLLPDSTKIFSKESIYSDTSSRLPEVHSDTTLNLNKQSIYSKHNINTSWHRISFSL